MSIFAIISILLWISGLVGAEEGSNIIGSDCITSQTPIDIVFLIDNSPSMATYQQQIANKLEHFVNLLDTENLTDHRFAIVVFGGEPYLRQTFTQDSTAMTNGISINLFTDSQEASLEAIRRTLNDDLHDKNNNPVKLNFRENALINLILITDEDSDLPLSTEYQTENELNEARLTGFTYEPGWQGQQLLYMMVRNSSSIPGLSPAFQKEVDITAELILEKKAKVNIVISGQRNAVVGTSYDRFICNSLDLYANGAIKTLAVLSSDCRSDTYGTWTGVWQYGSPMMNSQKLDYSSFSLANTLTNLENIDLGQSLQAQIIRGGGYGRVYDITDFLHDTNVAYFYQAVIDLMKICSVTVSQGVVAYEATTIINSYYTTIETQATVTDSNILIVPTEATTFTVTTKGESETFMYYTSVDDTYVDIQTSKDDIAIILTFDTVFNIFYEVEVTTTLFESETSLTIATFESITELITAVENFETIPEATFITVTEVAAGPTVTTLEVEERTSVVIVEVVTEVNIPAVELKTSIQTTVVIFSESAVEHTITTTLHPIEVETLVTTATYQSATELSTSILDFNTITEISFATLTEISVAPTTTTLQVLNLVTSFTKETVTITTNFVDLSRAVVQGTPVIIYNVSTNLTNNYNATDTKNYPPVDIIVGVAVGGLAASVAAATALAFFGRANSSVDSPVNFEDSTFNSALSNPFYSPRDAACAFPNLNPLYNDDI